MEERKYKSPDVAAAEIEDAVSKAGALARAHGRIATHVVMSPRLLLPRDVLEIAGLPVTLDTRMPDNEIRVAGGEPLNIFGPKEPPPKVPECILVVVEVPGAVSTWYVYAAPTDAERVSYTWKPKTKPENYLAGIRPPAKTIVVKPEPKTEPAAEDTAGPSLFQRGFQFGEAGVIIGSDDPRFKDEDFLRGYWHGREAQAKAKLDVLNEKRAMVRRTQSDTRTAIQRLEDERRRQVEVKGYLPEHDDLHDKGEMAYAAAAYASVAGALCRGANVEEFTLAVMLEQGLWPADWAGNEIACKHGYWKPSADPIRNLEKAGALIVAEIQRLKRKADQCKVQ